MKYPNNRNDLRFCTLHHEDDFYVETQRWNLNMICPQGIHVVI